MRVEEESQFLGSKRISTLRSQPPQGKSDGNGTNSSGLIIIIIIINFKAICSAQDRRFSELIAAVLSQCQLLLLV